MPEQVKTLSRVIAQLRGTAADDIPVSYDITCDCGAQVSGTRSTSWKQHVCSECHAELYVLPVNVYPRTPSVPSEVIGGSFTHRLTGVIADRLPGSTRDQSPPKRPSVERPATAEPVSNVPRRRMSLPKVSLPKIDVAAFFRRTFTPFRLLMLAMAVVVGGTSWWMWQQNSIEAARQAWRESLDEIPALLADGDLETLSNVARKAVDAGRILQRNGTDWREVSNLLSETEAVQQVSHATLPTLLLEACDSKGQLRTDRLDSLRAALENVAFVMDGFVDPSGSGPSAYTVDVPVIPGSRPVNIRLDMPGLDELLDQTESGQAVFAFRCDRVTTEGESDHDPVTLHVDPASFVLITRQAHCRRLGFPVDKDQALQERLAAQLTFVQESESWSQQRALLAANHAKGESL